VSETLSRPAASESQPGQPRSPEVTAPRRGRHVVRLALGIGVVAAAAGGAWLWRGDGSTETPPADSGPVATAEVTRGTLTATETWDGTLGYGSPFTVAAQGTGSGSEEETELASPSATVTRLVDQGATVGRGDELYRVNEEPVILLLGRIPMYRDLVSGASGPDVRQLEANLATLGYGGFTQDNAYTPSTAAAVRDWQADIGAQVTGTVSRSSVVFLPERGRVDGLLVDVGDPLGPGTEVLNLTGTEQVASLELDVDDRDLVELDTEVTVVLADGTEVAGTVTSLNVIQPETSAGVAEGAAPAPTDPVAEVEVTLAEPAPKEFLGAPVDVTVGVEKRPDVLSVPVNALLALAEGGYGLEVVRDDGTTDIVPVDTGLFATGRVEVRGPGIAEGTVVGVAGR
jgi:peptidoglycan hydrolase-like protein with peptidoglycan-binding domain